MANMDVQDSVVRIIRSMLEQASRTDVEVTPTARLHGDGGLGLDSLETAELSASLEDEFGSDPFSAGEMPETVAGIVAFYADRGEAGAAGAGASAVPA